MRLVALAAALLALAGCVSKLEPAQVLAPRDPAAAGLQVRRFDGVAPDKILSAALGALQDAGFQVMSSDAELGLIVAQRGYQKDLGEFTREFWRAFSQDTKNFWTFQWNIPQSDARRLSPKGAFAAVVSVAPAASGSSVRVTLHRLVTPPTGEQQVTWAEEVREPEAYARFYSLLTQALKK